MCNLNYLVRIVAVSLSLISLLVFFGYHPNSSSPFSGSFLVEAAQVGANYATTAVNVTGSGNVVWTSPGNATLSDNVRASASLSKLSVSNYLKATGFGFNLPDNARIDGIVVEWEKSDSVDGGISETYDNAVRLVKAGTIGTADKSDPGFWTTTDTFVTYGSGTTDTWSDTWTASDINNVNFGAAISAKNVKVSGGGTSTIAYIDSVRITVYYTLPTLTVGSTGPQVAAVSIGTTKRYLGGAFTASADFNTIDIHQITLRETGTINANLNLSNLSLYYNTAENCLYNGTETLFGTAPSFNSSEKATVTGSVSVGTSQVCFYPVVDIGSGALVNQTISLGISNPSADVGVSSGSVIPAAAVNIGGSTAIQPVVAISLTSSGSVGFGIVGLGASQTTTSSGVNSPQFVRIDSGPANLTLRSTNFTDGSHFWFLSNGIGDTQVQWSYSYNGSTWLNFSQPDTLYSYDSNVGTGATRPLFFKIILPVSTYSYNPYTSTVTIVATSP